MDQALWALAFSVLVLFAGCLQSQGPEGDQDEGTQDDPMAGPAPDLPWGLVGCAYVVSWGWVEGDRLDPYLPEGFTVRRGGGALAPAPDPRDTLFGMDIMKCSSGVVLNGTASPIDYGYLWAAADPPEAFLQEGIPPGEHYAKWEILVPDDERRGFLEERGLPVRGGSASLAPQPLRLEGDLALDGLGTISFSGVPTMEWEPFDGAFAKVSEADGGVAAWRASATSGPRSHGEALITFPESSWMAEVAEGTVMKASFHSGVWDYADARIVFLDHVDG